MNKRQVLLASIAALCGLGAVAARAESGPPLKIIVGTPAGGASDTAARLLGQTMARQSGRPVLVENRPGGNGVPAMLAVRSAAPDGTTLLWMQSSMAAVPVLVRAAPIKSMDEFVPVAPVINLVYGVFVNPKVPAGTMAELTAHLKANPDRLSYGTGVLSEYLVTEHVLQAGGLKALRVPYKGGAQLMPDLMSGELQFNIGPLAPALPHVRSGKLRLLATLPDRSEATPGVPALSESGIATDGLPIWNGLVAPSGTPAELAARLSQDINRALAEPALRGAFEAQGLRVTGGSPQQMAAALESAARVWRNFVRDHDIPQE